MLGTGSASGRVRGGRGRAVELEAACKEEAARDKRLGDALLAVPVRQGGRGLSRADAQSEGPQELQGLAVVLAPIDQYRYGRAGREECEAVVREPEAWLAQSCQRTRQDRLPQHVTVFMEMLSSPGTRTPCVPVGRPAVRRVRSSWRCATCSRGLRGGDPWSLHADSQIARGAATLYAARRSATGSRRTFIG